MEFYKVIEKRKSIREFEKKQIPKGKVIRIIKAAAMAASAGNAQPWEFYVVQSKNKRDEIARILREWLKKYARLNRNPNLKSMVEKFYYNLGDAPCIVFVYGNYKGIKKPGFYLKQSVDIAAGNIMNAAVTEGLGSCWIGSFMTEEKEISKLLGVPKGRELMAPIVLGYPKKGSKPLIREKKRLKEVLFWR